ncbi:hypothetical protein [Chelativorans sp. AA-79]|uniref:tetratricopeptide repeat protein n=1 Tax=Chelativorans sp. AA-79 TaxID=3028735 RepID=UPI0023FA145B|nr:hypothetical protein [Chelativorans sp. AA-79]WEX08908.1 hypothetical protein PVE73_23080 [Chelativorans sp. AA-79]
MRRQGPVLAVLPLDTATEADAVIARAFVEDLVGELARFSTMEVIAPMSGRAVADLADTEAARQLGATHILRGRFQREGERLQVTAHLVDGANGAQIWRERLETTDATLFDLENELLARIAATFVSRLEETILKQARGKPTDSLAAYELTLKGFALLRQGTRETDEEGRALFERALELDPHYARAYVGLSLSWFNEWGYQFWDRFQESWQLAYEYAHKALDLDDNDAMAHLVLGRLLIFNRDFERAAWYLDRALMLCPNDAELLIQQAINAVFLGHPEAAVEYAQKALRLNPYHRNSYYAVLALAYLMARDFEATLLTIGKISQMSEHAQLIEAPAYTAIVYAKLGQMDEARRQFALFQSNFRQSIISGREPEPDEACRWFLQHIPYRRQEDLTFSSRQISLPDMKGLRDIQRLIERTGEEIHCLDLAERGENSYGGDAMLDDKARTALKKRIRDLQEELAEAEDTNDLGQAERLRGELDQLVDTLASALGLGGRSRRVGSLTERARTTVTWRIRHALRKIEAVHEPLAKHLTNSLRTGTFCSYQPEQAIEWQLASDC